MSNSIERIKELTTKANTGDATAQNDLGCYHNGDGVSQDYAMAMQWYLKSAAQGNYYAQKNLGILYRYGYGCERNLLTAFHWIEKSALQGYANAEEELGIFYDFGYGVAADKAKAAEWYLKAAKKGHRLAQNNLGSLFEYGNGVPKDLMLARFLYQRAAKQGGVYAQCNLGILFEEGLGGPAQPRKALYWYQKSANNKHERATKRIEDLKNRVDMNMQIRMFTYPLLAKNPFRILGIYTNATAREVAANKAKIATFSKVGKAASFETDVLTKGLIGTMYPREADLFGVPEPTKRELEYRNQTAEELYKHILQLKQVLSPLNAQHKSELISATEDEDNDAELDKWNDLHSELKDVEYAYDVQRANAAIPVRNEEELNVATSQVSDNREKLKYALFWFCCVNETDKTALNYLLNSEYESASNLWEEEEEESFSSYLNVAILGFIQEDEECFVRCITTLIHNEELRCEFVKTVCGENFEISEDELSKLLIDTLLSEMPAVDWLTLFNDFGVSKDDDDYIKDCLSKTPVDAIVKELNLISSTNADSADAYYDALKRLMIVSDCYLFMLQSILNSKEDYRYCQICDQVAEQLVTTSKDYHRAYFTCQYEVNERCVEIAKFALNLACSSTTKSDIEEAYNEIRKIAAELPAKELFDPYSQIRKAASDILRSFEGKPHTIKEASDFILYCAPRIVKLKQGMGVHASQYISLSTEVVEVALMVAINTFNREFKVFDQMIDALRWKAASGTRVHFYDDKTKKQLDSLKQMVRNCCMLLVNLDRFDIDESFRSDRYEKNKSAILKQAEELGVNTSSMVPTISLFTEDEVYQRCMTLADYKLYLQRFPMGKHVNTARVKVRELEQQQKELELQQKELEAVEDAFWEICQKQKTYKSYLQSYPKGRYAKMAADKVASQKETQSFFTLAWVILVGIIGFLCIQLLTSSGEGNSARVTVLNRPHSSVAIADDSEEPEGHISEEVPQEAASTDEASFDEGSSEPVSDNEVADAETFEDNGFSTESEY